MTPLHCMKWLSVKLADHLTRIREDRQSSEYEKAKAKEGKCGSTSAMPATTTGPDDDWPKKKKTKKKPPDVKAPPATMPDDKKGKGNASDYPWPAGKTEGELQTLFAAFIKGKGRGKGKDGKSKTDKSGKRGKSRDATPKDSPRAGKGGDGKEGKAKEPCFYWVKFGNCSKEKNCGFDHAATLKGSNPDAVFPNKGYSAAVAADPGSSWIQAMLGGGTPPSLNAGTMNAAAVAFSPVTPTLAAPFLAPLRE